MRLLVPPSGTWLVRKRNRSPDFRDGRRARSFPSRALKATQWEIFDRNLHPMLQAQVCAIHSCGAVAEFHRASRSFRCGTLSVCDRPLWQDAELAFIQRSRHSSRRRVQSSEGRKLIARTGAGHTQRTNIDSVQGISRILPVVFRDSRSRWAWAASRSGYVWSIRILSVPWATWFRTSVARASRSARVAT